jgi:hypothetical protein
MFTCEGCRNDYRPAEGTAVARLYVKDQRCNHIEARCTSCGVTEVIYLGPNRLEDILRVCKVPVSVFAEATSRLRVRAERAWAAAEDHADTNDDLDNEPATLGQPPLEAGQPATEAPKSYELTSRHEELLSTFGRALDSIPDDLLWDGLQGDHDNRDLPPRWID